MLRAWGGQSCSQGPSSGDKVGGGVDGQTGRPIGTNPQSFSIGTDCSRSFQQLFCGAPHCFDMSDIEDLVAFVNDVGEEERTGSGDSPDLVDMIELGDPGATPEPDSDVDEAHNSVDLLSIVAWGVAPKAKYKSRSWELCAHARDSKRAKRAEARAEHQEAVGKRISTALAPLPICTRRS